MKKVLILVVFFISTKIFFACSCVMENIAQAYLESEIVAVVTVENTYGNKEYVKNGLSLRSYSADLKFDKIFKGEGFKTLNVLGTTTYANYDSCEKLVKKGEKYLILIKKNDNGDYFISACSTMPMIQENEIQHYQRIFDLIEKNKNKMYFKKFVNYHDKSQKYDEKKKEIESEFSTIKNSLKGKIGIYSVTINDNRKIVKILPIAKIGKSEKKIQELMKKNFIVKNEFEKSKGEYLILLEL